ncbi:MAG: hypothetical protein H0X39_11000 [Actinobacteria bacterium]|nr:hypothetical protein [Actinomycetota bacterium]
MSAPVRLGLAGGTFFLLGGAPAAITAILLTGLPSLLAALLASPTSPRLGRARDARFVSVVPRAGEPRFLDL